MCQQLISPLRPKKISSQNINDIIEDASKGNVSKVLAFDPEPKVSIDFNHTTHFSIFAPDQTRVVGANLLEYLLGMTMNGRLQNDRCCSKIYQKLI